MYRKFLKRLELILPQAMMLHVPFSRLYLSCSCLAWLVHNYVIRSIVGRPRHQGVMVGMGQKDSYVGLVVLS